jgi:hypothetical protein
MGGNIGFNSGLSTAESTIGMRYQSRLSDGQGSHVVGCCEGAGEAKNAIANSLQNCDNASQILPDASAHSKDGSLAEGTIA